MARNGKNIYRRKDGRCEGRIYYEGRKYKSVYGRTYKEVYEKMIKLRCKMGFKDAKDYYFNTIAELWLEEKENTVKKSSVVAYRTKLKNHILPYFTDVFMSKVTNATLSAFVAAKRAEGLSDKYISDMVIIIKSISVWAEENYSVKNSVKKFKTIHQIPKEPKLLSKDEQTRLHKHLSEKSDGTSVSLLTEMYTGLRIGELCALRWGDIDFENDVIRVNKSIQRLPDSATGKTRVMVTSTKTSTSDRVIPISSFLKAKLKEAQKADNCYLLSGSEKIVEPRTLTNRFKAVLSAAGVSDVNFHSLRHGFATRCIQKNVDIKTVSELLGHSSMNITMKTYIHSDMQRKRECVEQLKWA